MDPDTQGNEPKRRRLRRRKRAAVGVKKCDHCAHGMKFLDLFLSYVHPAGNLYPRRTPEGKRVETQYQRLCRSCRRRAVQHRRNAREAASG